MSKLFKRLGSKATKFDLEIVLHWLEINISDSEHCKCSIVFRRGFNSSPFIN